MTSCPYARSSLKPELWLWLSLQSGAYEHEFCVCSRDPGEKCRLGGCVASVGYQRKPGQVRIIGGRWRGRKVQFLERPDLRPTPDRVRETLFNWLAPVVTGARCLDLFAGSGVLGIEALSRGAQHVVMVDADPQVAAMLQQQLRRLDCDEAQVSVKDGLAYLRGPPRGFDIVFLDPPYASGLLGPCCDLLEARQWLAPEARIYLEIRRRTAFPELPENWSVVRSKHAGQVTYCLALREQATD